MDSTANILQFCRLCLVKDGVNIPIFDEQGDIRQIYLKISSCLPVKVAREDHLPKKICDGCSNKLDICYDFWRTSAESEKQLLAWLGATGKDAAQVNVKEEDNFDEPLASDISKNDDDENKCYMFEQKVEEGPPVEINDEPPPSKRPRRTAAVKAAIAMDQNSDDDGDSGEPITKMEDDSDETDGDDREPAFVDVPSTSADDQPGPSGVSKDGSDAPMMYHQDFTSHFNLESSFQPCKYFMDFPYQKPCTDNILETSASAVDHLNDTDAELLDLLATQEDCSAILENIASNEQFQKLINNETDFALENFIDSSCTVVQGQKDDKREAKERLRCDQCGRECSTKKLLKKHLLIHTQEKKFSCEECGKKFRHKYEVTAHKRSHSTPTFQCDICSKMFIHRSHLNAHRKKHFGEYTAFCQTCQMGFVSMALYRAHRNAYHDSAQVICDICGAKLSTLSALKEHKVTHDPEHGKERVHVCEICGKNYLTVRNLRSHVKTHSNLKMHVCSICGKSVSSKAILETHIKMHTGVRDFHCSVCNKTFASKEYLQTHQRIHTGDKPFECHVCGKTFTQKTSLTVHIRYHTGQKPYKCECGKEFTTKSHLMTHYKTHDIGGVDIEYISRPLL